MTENNNELPHTKSVKNQPLKLFFRNNRLRTAHRPLPSKILAHAASTKRIPEPRPVGQVSMRAFQNLGIVANVGPRYGAYFNLYTPCLVWWFFCDDLNHHVFFIIILWWFFCDDLDRHIFFITNEAHYIFLRLFIKNTYKKIAMPSELRHALGLSQPALAALLQCGTSQLAMYETGKRPRPDIRASIWYINLII